MQYELNHKEIPHILDDIVKKLTTANESDQKKIAKDFVESLKKKHRTTQQLLIKLLSNIIKEYSNVPFDRRNKDSIVWARVISNFNNNFEYI